MRGPSAALRRHCRWVKDLQSQVKADQDQANDLVRVQEERKIRMAEGFKKQRDAIRQMKKDRGGGPIEPHEVEAIIRPREKRAPSGAQKPLWAMTEEEKEGFDDEQAADLIDFAESLDFDSYIDDLEFRQCLRAVQDRAKKLQREQNAFKDSLINEFNMADDNDEGDEDAQSTSAGRSNVHRGLSHATGIGDRPDWDSSTVGDDQPSGKAARDTRSAAQRVLEEQPQFRGVHSKGSMQRIIEKAHSEMSA